MGVAISNFGTRVGEEEDTLCVLLDPAKEKILRRTPSKGCRVGTLGSKKRDSALDRPKSARICQPERGAGHD